MRLVSSQELGRQDYDEILRRFLVFVEDGVPPELCRGKVVATLFFTPSTRTMNMFQSAIIRAGGGWIGFSNEGAVKVAERESLEDTIREYSSLADCILLRHNDDDSAERAACVASVPVINGGSGSKEHAVAAATLLCRIRHYLKRSLDNLTIGIYGSAQLSRVLKALVPALGLYGARLHVDDLHRFPLPHKVEAAAKAQGAKYLVYESLQNFLPIVDLLFVTWEGVPFSELSQQNEGVVAGDFIPITTADMKKMREDGILYVLKPRTIEVDRDVDADPRSAYARQEPYAESALAVLTYLLDIIV